MLYIDMMLSGLFKVLILTIIIELIGAIILGIRKKTDLIIVLLVQIATNPLLNIIARYINIYYGLLYRRIFILIGEIIVVLAEGLIYKKSLTYKKINPFILSLILNMSSYLICLIIRIIGV